VKGPNKVNTSWNTQHRLRLQTQHGLKKTTELLTHLRTLYFHIKTGKKKWGPNVNFWNQKRPETLF